MSANLVHYPPNPAYGTGVYRRRLCFLRRADGIDVSLLDDYHDMGVALTVVEDVIIDVVARMDRFPKTTCPGAAMALRTLIDQPAAASALSLSALERAEQCTHLVHLARLGLSWLARGDQARIIEVSLTDRDTSARQMLALERDGRLALAWVVQDACIMEPSEHRGRNLFGGFARWAQEQFSPGEADLWSAAQMAVFVARARAYLVDGHEPRRVADEPSRRGACYSFSGAAFETAYDNTGYFRDMSKGLPPLRSAAPDYANEGT